MSKAGLVGDYSVLSGSVIRLLAGTTVMWAFALPRKQAGPSFRALQSHPRALTAVMGGTLTGPVLGTILSLVAVQNAPVGIVSTLSSMAPIILLPVDRFMFGARIGARSAGGTLLAFTGTALLFL